MADSDWEVPSLFDSNIEETINSRCAQVRYDQRFREIVDGLLRNSGNPNHREVAEYDLGCLIHEYLLRRVREAEMPRFKTARKHLNKLRDLLSDTQTEFQLLMRYGVFEAAIEHLQNDTLAADLIDEFDIEIETSSSCQLPAPRSKLCDLLWKLERFVELAAEGLEQDNGGARTVAHVRATADEWLCVNGLKILLYFDSNMKMTKCDTTVRFIENLFSLVRDYDDPRVDWQSGKLNPEAIRIVPDVDRLVSWAAPKLRALRRAGGLDYIDRKSEHHWPTFEDFDAADTVEDAICLGARHRPRKKEGAMSPLSPIANLAEHSYQVSIQLILLCNMSIYPIYT